MTEVRFYHLRHKKLEDALPTILEKALERGMRIIVMSGDEKQLKNLNSHLWTYQDHSFLPHGMANDGSVSLQPIYLTCEDENPNKADLLISVYSATSEKMADYELCCEVFDGLDQDEVQAARQKWKRYKEAGYKLIYYQQSAEGRWEQKATA